MEAARTSETSADIQLRTRQYIPEESELQTFLLIIPIDRNHVVIFETFTVTEYS
jgi:hypothetical protein